MGFETVNNPSKRNSRFELIQGKQFEIIEQDVLIPSDIEDGDRVFIKTASGNRYMIRRSKSAGGKLKIYNEREGFETGYQFALKEGSSTIAAKGEGLEIFAFTDVEKKQGHVVISSEVENIEIRKGFDTAAEEGAFKPQSLTKRLKDRAAGRENDK